MEGRLLETILKDGARSGVPRCGANRPVGRSEPRPPGRYVGRGKPLRLRCPTAGDESVGPGRKPPRWSAERGPGRPGTGWSRVAGATGRKSGPVGAPSTPHRGDARRKERTRKGS